MAEWNCFTCKKQNNDAVCFRCKDGSEYIKQTNADRIRSMTDEELAEFLRNINTGYDISYGDYISMNEGIFISDRKDLAKEILKWLQSEAE